MGHQLSIMFCVNFGKRSSEVLTPLKHSLRKSGVLRGLLVQESVDLCALWFKNRTDKNKQKQAQI